VLSAPHDGRAAYKAAAATDVSIKVRRFMMFFTPPGLAERVYKKVLAIIRKKGRRSQNMRRPHHSMLG
jgi:hypothetical protein